MHIKHEKPPLYDLIAARFKLDGHKPIFAWGNTLYQPFSTDELPEYLIAHERVHGARQIMLADGIIDRDAAVSHDDKIRLWWERYCKDDRWRLEEELMAHRAEYIARALRMSSRADRRRALTTVAQRLCSPLYGWPRGMVNETKAKMLLKEEF